MAVVRDDRAGRQTSQVHVLAAPMVQEQQLQSRYGARMPGALPAAFHLVLLINRVNLMEFDQQRATAFAGGGVGRAGGIAQVGAGRVVPLFIRERALENEDLFAKRSTTPQKRCTSPGRVGRGTGLVMLKTRKGFSVCLFSYL